MLKPDSLRSALDAVFPDIVRDPDRCKLFVDKGRIAARFPAPGTPPCWEWRYRLNLRMFDYTDHPDRLILPILTWLAVNQPELLLNHANGDQALPFEADIIDDKTIDISIDLELVEAVRAVPREGGGWDMIHVAEPSPLDPLLEGAVDGAPLNRIWLAGEQLVPTLPLDPPQV
jgi:hypothetical protein